MCLNNELITAPKAAITVIPNVMLSGSDTGTRLAVAAGSLARSQTVVLD